MCKERAKITQNAATCCICGKRFTKKFAQDKNYRKVIDHCNCTDKYRGVSNSIHNLRFNVPNEILAVVHNRSNYDYHFIIKELANKSEGQFECLVEKTEKYKKSSVAIEKEIVKVDKDGNEVL